MDKEFVKQESRCERQESRLRDEVKRELDDMGVKLGNRLSAEMNRSLGLFLGQVHTALSGQNEAK